jgi:glycosyltransferase involved in cell wall biosynthesis
MRHSQTIVLLTASYPYDGAAEQTFLNLEVEQLNENFEQVIIVPTSRKGKRLSIPADIEVDESYASGWEKTGKIEAIISALMCPQFYKELATRPMTFIQLPVLKGLLKFVAEVEYTHRWVHNFIMINRIDTQTTLFYTYWLESFTTGLGLSKKECPQIRLISRAHRYDLYEHQRVPPYIPCRVKTLKSLDCLFLISEDGKNYVSNKYSKFANLCEVSRLGVRDCGFVTPSSRDGVFRIVSCSFMVEVKRLDQLLQGIKVAAQLRPQQKFEWHHLGDGPLNSKIQSMAQGTTLPNLKCYFYGHLSNEKIISFYRDNPVDVFMNVSKSEGIPVSIMEAQSCSIPIIATAVGGTPEIVSNHNGKLLSPNPTPTEIGKAIYDLLDHPELLAEYKTASRSMWQDRYDAARNYPAFARRLQSLLNQSTN